MTWRRGLLVVLGGLMACDRPRGTERDGPLVVERYELLELRPLDLDAAARRGDSIPLTLGGRRFVLQLQPKNLVAPGCTVIELAAQPVTTPCPTDLGTYAGGDAHATEWTQARLSITPAGLIGTVRTADVTWMIEPLRDTTGTLPPGVVRHVAYRTSDVSGRRYFEASPDTGLTRRDTAGRERAGKPQAMRDDDDNRGCDPEDRPCAPTKPTGGGPPPPPPPIRTLGIAFAADRQYVDQARLGTSFFQRIAVTLNMVDGMYRREGVATFQIMVVIADPLDRFFGSPNPTDLLMGLLPAYAAANLDLTVSANRVARGVSTAFLTSGKPVAGDTLGMANEPGIDGMAFQDLSYSVDPGTAAGKEWQNWMVMAHELGHIYNGDHAEADWFCRFWFMWGIWCWNSARTIMWPGFSFRSSPEFSRGRVAATQNNWRRLTTNLPMRIP